MYSLHSRPKSDTAQHELAGTDGGVLSPSETEVSPPLPIYQDYQPQPASQCSLLVVIWTYRPSYTTNKLVVSQTDFVIRTIYKVCIISISHYVTLRSDKV